MSDDTLHLSGQQQWMISQAAADFFWFQNRGYPRSSALGWVGDRYRLTSRERQLLHRGVFAQRDALLRFGKRCKGAGWQKEKLIVDGHNVQITIESAILGRPLLLGNDGALRDLAGQSARFRFSETGEMALDAVFRFLGELRPREVLFLFDAPLSHSGLLASKYRERMKALGLRGEARAVLVPEREFDYDQAVIASSDAAVLDDATLWLDLAHWVIDSFMTIDLTFDFSPLVLTKPDYPSYPLC